MTKKQMTKKPAKKAPAKKAVVKKAGKTAAKSAVTKAVPPATSKPSVAPLVLPEGAAVGSKVDVTFDPKVTKLFNPAWDEYDYGTYTGIIRSIKGTKVTVEFDGSDTSVIDLSTGRTKADCGVSKIRLHLIETKAVEDEEEDEASEPAPKRSSKGPQPVSVREADEDADSSDEPPENVEYE